MLFVRGHCLFNPHRWHPPTHPVSRSVAAEQTPETGMDLATPKAFVQNPPRGAVVASVQCSQP